MARIAKKSSRPKPLVLIVLEGWGVAPAHAGNAISEADPVYFKYLLSHFPALTLEASGEAVGLVPGRAVTSEDGYALIGSGRPILSSRRLVDERIAAGDFDREPGLVKALERARAGKLHLIGLLSPAERESSLPQLEAILAAAEKSKVSRICLHAILDGRDASKTAGKNLLMEWEKRLAGIGGTVSTLCGRFYALDPFRLPARIGKAADAIVSGKGNRAASAVEAAEENYAKKIYDEEFPPTVLEASAAGSEIIDKGDTVLFFNFASQSIQALAEAVGASGAACFSLTEYNLGDKVEPIFKKPSGQAALGDVISAAGYHQLRLSDSEGFSGITAFLNGGGEQPLPGEERKILPLLPLEDYAEEPELANAELAKETVRAIDEKKYDFIALSFASIDRLAHSANLEATVRTIRSVDAALEKIISSALAAGGAAVVTSTHGLAEQTISATAEGFSSHTGRIVPLLLIAKEIEGFSLGLPQPLDGDLSALAAAGTLCDVAPSILRMMRLPVPPEMTGKSFFDPKHLV